MSGKAIHQANNEKQYLEYVAVGLAALQKKFCSQVFGSSPQLISSNVTTVAIQITLSMYENLELELIGIKFKFYQAIIDKGVRFKFPVPDSLNSIAVLNMSEVY